ncbi:rRNA maturation RNase YbeY [Chelativorans sp.]|uniref:rRNA maturation RNase YbeY n=1 Tax=Chelativorans sp. TaxID=2203393 RepID=UPI0028124D56|nr:rRNA maturation RNase YbeY [Chelativorans sp.]
MAENSQPSAISVHCVVEAGEWPPQEVLQHFAEQAVAATTALVDGAPAGPLTILFTDDAEMRAMNARFRGKDKPTNVLSFPAEARAFPPGAPRHLGDIALGYGIVASEAEAEEKPFEHHLTHLLVHGFLHILGYDHELPQQAEDMEALERQILQSLAIPDPYA